MPKADEGGRIENRRREIGQNSDAAMGHSETGGSLHPGIGGDDPESRKMRAEKHQKSGPPVCPTRYAVTAEYQDSEKNRFKKKGQDHLSDEWRAENIPDHPRIPRPVAAERKFHDDPGRRSKHENQTEDPRQKRRHVAEPLLPFPEISRFDDEDDQGQGEGRRRKDEMESNGKRELQTGKHHRVHLGLSLENLADFLIIVTATQNDGGLDRQIDDRRS